MEGVLSGFGATPAPSPSPHSEIDIFFPYGAVLMLKLNKIKSRARENWDMSHRVEVSPKPVESSLFQSGLCWSWRTSCWRLQP